MKTSKARSKPGKNPRDKEAVRSKKLTISKSLPSEMDIREKAKEIYNQRIDRGDQGTSVDDWLLAEKFLTDSDN